MFSSSEDSNTRFATNVSRDLRDHTRSSLYSDSRLPPAQPHQAPDTPLPPLSQNSPSPQPKRKYTCPTCDRSFTTSGHLARHGRVHTGERNHKCPFPGCETRCSRQDNLQQHYRIHLSPGSRRTSASATRAAMTRAMSTSSATAGTTTRSTSQRRRSRTMTDIETSTISSPALSSPPISPPPLAPAYRASASAATTMPDGLPEPPNTPPPLADSRLSMYPSFSQSGSNITHSSVSSSPEMSYYSPSAHSQLSLYPVGANQNSPQELRSSLSSSSQWSYYSDSAANSPYTQHQRLPSPGYAYAAQTSSPASSVGSRRYSQTPGMTHGTDYAVSGHYDLGRSSMQISQPVNLQSFGSNSGQFAPRDSSSYSSPLSAQSMSPASSHSSPSSVVGYDHSQGNGSSLMRQQSGGDALEPSFGPGSLSTMVSIQAMDTFSTSPSPVQQQSSQSYFDTISTTQQSRSNRRNLTTPPVLLAPIQDDHDRLRHRRLSDPSQYMQVHQPQPHHRHNLQSQSYTSLTTNGYGSTDYRVDTTLRYRDTGLVQ